MAPYSESIVDDALKMIARELVDTVLKQAEVQSVLWVSA